MSATFFLTDMRRALGHAEAGSALINPSGAFASAFATTDFAAASVAAAGCEVAELIHASTGQRPQVAVDTRLASNWFMQSVRPIGWQLPPVWDAVAGDYATQDGWIRLHTNAAHHRAAALMVLGVAAERELVAKAVASWQAPALEAAVVQAGGCAAAMQSAQAWRDHPQGRAAQAEPLIHFEGTKQAETRQPWQPKPGRPLDGIRVLDLTRVLAGPVATRFLAGYGAEVLRIDPPEWEEPSLEPEVTMGKRCARLDLTLATDRAVFEALLSDADVLVHGYRSDALAAMGLDAARRRALQPQLIDVSLDAYGFTGPWAARRGFDSLVQMSCGIAHAGMLAKGATKPTPLPAQALDHATGYLMAAAAVRGLQQRLAKGTGTTAKLSLARTARLLMDGPATNFEGKLDALRDEDFQPEIETTPWGPLQRLKPPLAIEGATHRWASSACALGSSRATWAT